MLGLMQDHPLLISSLINFADRHHGATKIVSRTSEGMHRYTYRDAHVRSRKLANALRRLGVSLGDRIATLAWNNHRHFELYYATSGIGAVCHTINPRLFPNQLVYIINHAADRYVFFDAAFAPLIAALREHCPRVEGWVALADRAQMPESLPDALCYEELVDGETAELDWPQFDEHTASSLCYTSGTTGDPKGVLYSHRSTVLHSFGAALPDAMNISARDVVLPIVPMFHANAWGAPYTCALTGAKLVFPGAALDGKSLYELFEAERVTFSAGVPAVWLGLLHYLAENRLRFSTLQRVVIGGSACPPAMMRALEALGVEVLHAWGMTEMSPLGTVCQLRSDHRDKSPDELVAVRAKQGRALFGVDLKIVGGAGEELPWDGTAFGDLLVRGPWIARGYFGGEAADTLQDGWFATGDVATIDADGYMQITDRSKDVIKSGGEWISSIELENIAMAHPAVAEAAVIGVRHARWDERPLLVVQAKADAEITRDALIAFYQDKVARWWIPDDVVFVASLPHTATGKLLKTQLRQEFADHLVASAPLDATGRTPAE
jgi:acyl-CoA synthetase (AMP-forming)/AMP-acid ligase II